MEAKLFTGQQNITNCMQSQFTESSLEDFLEECVDRAFQWSPENDPDNVESFQMYPRTELTGINPMIQCEGVVKQEAVNLSVQALDLKDSYEKGQSRRKANSQQRLLDGEVNFLLTTMHQLQAAYVYVERVPEAARVLQDTTGRVPLNIIWKKSHGTQISFSVDLDSVYETSAGTKVYELSRVKGDERNIFQLILLLSFVNGESKEFVTKRFRVKSKVNLQKPESREDLEGGAPSADDRVSFSYHNSPSHNRKRKRETLGDCSPGSISSGFGSDVSSYSEIITEHLEAKSATIEELKLRKPILTSCGDIAYHLPLDETLLDSEEEFEEGDIVGFFEDKDGKTCIQKLTHFNAHKFKLAGVISRSAYLEAKVNIEENKEDEVICMIGMVRVKVMGQVKNGERIYASMENPGIAIAQSRLIDATAKEAVLLGQSLETTTCKSYDVTRPQCFVSLILTIGTSHMTQAINDLRTEVREDVKSEVKQHKKKYTRVCRKWSAVAFVIAVLLSILFYQLFAPGTALRYYQCSRGSIEDSEMYFTFETHDLQRPRVHGIEFRWRRLKKKLGLKFGRMHLKGAKYYLNLDRCAHGGIRLVASRLDGLPMVRGAEIVAVNSNCTVVYYHSRMWTKYDSATDIVCSP